jgi:hypothetical protein
MGVVIGFAPWIVYAVVSGVGAGWQWAGLAALTVSIASLLRDRLRGVTLDAQVLDLSSLAFFVALTIFAFINPTSPIQNIHTPLFLWIPRPRRDHQPAHSTPAIRWPSPPPCHCRDRERTSIHTFQYGHNEFVGSRVHLQRCGGRYHYGLERRAHREHRPPDFRDYRSANSDQALHCTGPPRRSQLARHNL